MGLTSSYCDEKINSVHVGVFGLCNSGKTSFVDAMVKHRNKIDGIHFVFHDVGSESDGEWSACAAGCHAFIFMIDASAPRTFRKSREKFEKILSKRGTGLKPVLIFANKQDLNDALPPKRLHQVFGIANTTQFSVHGLTATTGNGAVQGMRWLIDALCES